MGHERVLNEDKVAHPDEGMVGIMRGGGDIYCGRWTGLKGAELARGLAPLNNLGVLP